MVRVPKVTEGDEVIDWQKDQPARDAAYLVAKEMAAQYQKVLEEAVFVAFLKGYRWAKDRQKENPVEESAESLMGEE